MTNTAADLTTDDRWRRAVHAAAHAVLLDCVAQPPTDIVLPLGADCPFIGGVQERARTRDLPKQVFRAVAGVAVAGVAAESLILEAEGDISDPSLADYNFASSLLGEGPALREVAATTLQALQSRRRALLALAGALLAKGSLSAGEVAGVMRLDRERPLAPTRARWAPDRW